ncbi:MAG: Hsp20 family protein [Terriglobia bacterium]|jgi:HSP20 family protein|nr:Hsp20 family protein [Terriglobia bacterium]
MTLKKTSGNVAVASSVMSGPDTSNAIDQQIHDFRHRIAQRAFDLCSQRGWIHGHDLEDWLRAEAEILTPAAVEIVDNGEEYNAEVEVPGFREQDLDILCDTNRILIRGNTEKSSRQKDQNGRVLYSDRQSNMIFRVIELPQEVKPEDCEAVVRDGVLNLILPKARASKPMKVQVRAA